MYRMRLPWFIGSIVLTSAIVILGSIGGEAVRGSERIGGQEKPNSEAPAQQEAPPKPTGLDVLAQTKQCKKCHLDTYAEWESSRHAKSWSSEVFQAAIKDLPDKGDGCARCHAPDTVPLTGFGKLPISRPEHRELGITCVTCHMDGKKYFGPHASKGHGGIVVSDAYRKVDICASCHGHPEVNAAHDQVTSYLKSPAFENDSNCQHCHMEEVTRPLVLSKEKLRDVQGPMECREHKFEGSHTTGKATEAASLSLTIDKDAVVVDVSPRTGHTLPSSEGREVRLEVVMLDAEGKQVEKAQRVWDTAKKTALAPQDVNEFRYQLPAAAAKVTAKLELVFQKVPGRDAEIVMPIADASADRPVK